MRYNRTKASRLTYSCCMFLLVVGYPLWLKFMTLEPKIKYTSKPPFTPTRHVNFVKDHISPFGNAAMCDQCQGNGEAVRFPVEVTVSNFTAMDQAAYVVLYVSQDWDRWWQPGYPSILSSVNSANESIKVCQVPQQYSGAPSQQPSPEPTKDKTLGRRSLQAMSLTPEEQRFMESLEDLPPPNLYHPVPEADGGMQGAVAEEEQRRLAKVRVPPKTASGALIDDFMNDDIANAELGCCLGSPGQMWMVACVMRNWPGTKQGQQVRGPPFDDRCVALSGVCGTTCGSMIQSPDKQCVNVDAHTGVGTIPQRYLVADYCGSADDDENCGKGVDAVDDDYAEHIKEQKDAEDAYFRLFAWETSDSGNENWWAYVTIIKDKPFWHWSFMCMMFMAYTSMVLAYIPGIGRCGSSRARLPILHTLNSQGAIRDGVECVSFSISASEHKLWVLRNLVGKIASSFYHPQALLTDFFMDETARSGAYALWDALSRLVDKDESCEVDMVGFMKAWAARLRDPAELLQETEDRFKTRSEQKKLLSQIELVVDPFHNIGSLAQR